MANAKNADKCKSTSTNSLGSLIRKLRKEAGLTQQQLADQIGYSSYEIISRWENNKQKPTIDVLVKIARATKASEDELYELIMTEHHVQTHFLPCATTLAQLKDVARHMERLTCPAYLLDYRGRFWAINSGIAQLMGVSLEKMWNLKISLLDVVFDSRLPFKAKLGNFEAFAIHQIACFKMTNLYRRHEPFYQNVIINLQQKLLSEDFNDLRRLWNKVTDKKPYTFISQVWQPVVFQEGDTRRNYYLHANSVHQLGKDLFTLVWYQPENWQQLPVLQPSASQKVLCLWDIINVSEIFEK
jgi:transcriptional regulator with XRE-family HTH domain